MILIRLLGFTFSARRIGRNLSRSLAGSVRKGSRWWGTASGSAVCDEIFINRLITVTPCARTSFTCGEEKASTRIGFLPNENRNSSPYVTVLECKPKITDRFAVKVDGRKKNVRLSSWTALNARKSEGYNNQLVIALRCFWIRRHRRYPSRARNVFWFRENIKQFPKKRKIQTHCYLESGVPICSGPSRASEKFRRMETAGARCTVT